MSYVCQIFNFFSSCWYLRSAISIQNDELIRIILIISDTHKHSYLFQYYTLGTHNQSLKDSYLTILMMSLISTLYENHKIYMIRIRTLQYSVECCMCALLAVFFKAVIKSQSPYSLDLAAVDSFLFPKSKIPMKGKRFATIEKIKEKSKQEPM